MYFAQGNKPCVCSERVAWFTADLPGNNPMAALGQLSCCSKRIPIETTVRFFMKGLSPPSPPSPPSDAHSVLGCSLASRCACRSHGRSTIMSSPVVRSCYEEVVYVLQVGPGKMVRGESIFNAWSPSRKGGAGETSPNHIFVHPRVVRANTNLFVDFRQPA